MIGAFKDLAEEFHGAGGVGQCCQSGLMGCGEEYSYSNSNGFVGVVNLGAVVALCELEHDDEPGGDFEEWFFRISAEGREVSQPTFSRATLIELSFLGFSSQSYLSLDFGISNTDEAPRLFVGAAGCTGGGADDPFDGFG